ncbi:MAG TPA: hypothetical protein VFU50_18125 [Terriglobales bacterium]|nr:hypothetical protein [Terriglobales bacterium]
MSIRYQIDGKRRIVFTAMAGTLSFRQLVSHAVALQSDPCFHSSFCELLDVRGVTESDLSFREMIELAQTIDPFSPAARRAIVAGSELMYGSSRMYQSIRADESNIQVFRSMEEARKWLDITWDSDLPDRQSA